MKLVLHNSDGEVIKEMPMAKLTNFDRIAASPEKLAEFIGMFSSCSFGFCVCDVCEGLGVPGCEKGGHCYIPDGYDSYSKEAWLNWLQESE